MRTAIVYILLFCLQFLTGAFASCPKEQGSKQLHATKTAVEILTIYSHQYDRTTLSGGKNAGFKKDKDQVLAEDDDEEDSTTRKVFLVKYISALFPTSAEFPLHNIDKGSLSHYAKPLYTETSRHIKLRVLRL